MPDTLNNYYQKKAQEQEAKEKQAWNQKYGQSYNQFEDDGDYDQQNYNH